MNKYFYHFTHIDNLDSILKHGLLCTNKKKELSISHFDISNRSIQDRRANMEILCEDNISCGRVHDYVPFYFTTRSPMLLSIINQKKVDQPELIFLGVKTEEIKKRQLIFTDSSANTLIPPNFYKNFENLSRLDWGIINSNKWSYEDDERHRKMAEVLVKNFDISLIDHIVIFNDYFRTKVKKILEENKIKNSPKLELSYVDGRHFYFTKFFIESKKSENLVTGPKHLKLLYDETNSSIIKNREKIKYYICNTKEDLIQKLDENFEFLPETKGIFGLETKNDVHNCTVSEHTLEVVSNVRKHKVFPLLNKNEQEILILSAYLHDIGKGPHEKWQDRIQPAYADHPKDSLIQSERILTESIENLTKNDIRLLTLLITYHDLLGDLSRDYRNIGELKGIITSRNDLCLLFLLSQADILALRLDWHENLIAKFEKIEKEIPL